MFTFRSISCLVLAAVAVIFAPSAEAAARRLNSQRGITGVSRTLLAGDAMPGRISRGAYADLPRKVVNPRRQEKGAPIPGEEDTCGHIIVGADINVGEGNIDGSGTIVAGIEECIHLCAYKNASGFPCNAAIFVEGLDACFMKHVEIAHDVPVYAPGMSLYVQCPPEH